MLRTLKGIVLGLMAQGAAHLLIVWPLNVRIFPPNGWHLLPFLVGGAVCGRYAGSAWPALAVSIPYAALVVFADIMVGPRLSALAAGFAVVGVAIGMMTCGWLARRRRRPPAVAPPEPQAPLP